MQAGDLLPVRRLRARDLPHHCAARPTFCRAEAARARPAGRGRAARRCWCRRSSAASTSTRSARSSISRSRTPPCAGSTSSRRSTRAAIWPRPDAAAHHPGHPAADRGADRGHVRGERLHAGAVLLPHLQLGDLRLRRRRARSRRCRASSTSTTTSTTSPTASMPDLSDEIKAALEGLWSSSAVAGSREGGAASSPSPAPPAACPDAMASTVGDFARSHVHDHAAGLHGPVDLQPEEPDEVLQGVPAARTGSRFRSAPTTRSAIASRRGRNSPRASGRATRRGARGRPTRRRR